VRSKKKVNINLKKSSTMKNMPTVFVIISTYNRADLIVETLESVFAQTYKDYDVLGIDDASTNNTEGVLAPY